MNFLSHFYFDRLVKDPYHILGIVLPDLLKNADKKAIIHPERLPFQDDPDINSIISGWKKHLIVDKYFHSSSFFRHHSHQLKIHLLPALVGSPVKPFFLGHIALELLIDYLLIKQEIISVDTFYDEIGQTKASAITRFLCLNNLPDPLVYINFHEKFLQHRYLYSYADLDGVTYALKQICLRLWKIPFDKAQENEMALALSNYQHLLADNFLEIFVDIEDKVMLSGIR
ncbi:MAG: hypothetical protein ACOH2A_02100 [Sphingobacteriaceae bacterium]